MNYIQASIFLAVLLNSNPSQQNTIQTVCLFKASYPFFNGFAVSPSAHHNTMLKSLFYYSKYKPPYLLLSFFQDVNGQIDGLYISKHAGLQCQTDHS